MKISLLDSPSPPRSAPERSAPDGHSRRPPITPPKTVKIVMHDPGCHWFVVHGKYAKTDTVKANRVRLVDHDEAALKVASRHGVRHVALGKSIVVGRGHYVIMMVGQAPDDNYLKLTVR